MAVIEHALLDGGIQLTQLKQQQSEGRETLRNYFSY